MEYNNSNKKDHYLYWVLDSRLQKREEGNETPFPVLLKTFVSISYPA